MSSEAIVRKAVIPAAGVSMEVALSLLPGIPEQPATARATSATAASPVPPLDHTPIGTPLELAPTDHLNTQSLTLAEASKTNYLLDRGKSARFGRGTGFSPSFPSRIYCRRHPAC